MGLIVSLALSLLISLGITLGGNHLLGNQIGVEGVAGFLIMFFMAYIVVSFFLWVFKQMARNAQREVSE